MSLGSFLSEQDKGNGDTKIRSVFILAWEAVLGVHPKNKI